jgi:hypothetical protein
LLLSDWRKSKPKDTPSFSEDQVYVKYLSDHLVQRGPSFKQEMEISVEASTGQITIRYKAKNGKEKVLKEQHELPPDVANGLLFTLVKHIQPKVPQTTVSMVATTPKPRVVKLEILPDGEKAIASGNTKHETVCYVVKVKIGCSWPGCAPPGEAASRHARMGARGQRSSLRQIGGSALRWWPDLADRTGNSGRYSNPSQMHPSVFKQNFLPSGFVCRPVPLLRMNRSPGLAHPMVISLV